MWCCDITWLPGPIRGQFYFLYLIIDLYSRKIVGWEVHEVENSAQARDLVEQACPARSLRGWREGILDPPRVLHGDNGSPLKGATVQALLSRLGITASFSRPRVSDGNARSLSRMQPRGRGSGDMLLFLQLLTQGVDNHPQGLDNHRPIAYKKQPGIDTTYYTTVYVYCLSKT